MTQSIRFLAYDLRGRKFELTNQDSTDGENFTVLTLMYANKNDIEIEHFFLATDGIKSSQKGIYTSRRHIRLQKGKKHEIFCLQKFTGNSPAVHRVTVECRQLRY